MLSLLALLTLPAAAQGTPACAIDPAQLLKVVTVEQIPSMVRESEGCVLLLELYASWCGPCAKIAPSVAEISARYQPRGLRVQGISVDTDQERLKKWTEQHGGVFPPMVLDRWTLAELDAIFAGMGADFQDAVPFFLLFDRAGKLVFQASEPSDLAGLEEALKGVL